MNVSLTVELESWIAERVKSGLYRSSSEVVREAVRLLRDHEHLKALQRDALVADLRRGVADLEGGRARSLDASVMDDIRRAARERAEES